jgi:hypothetical protein
LLAAKLTANEKEESSRCRAGTKRRESAREKVISKETARDCSSWGDCSLEEDIENRDSLEDSLRLADGLSPADRLQLVSERVRVAEIEGPGVSMTSAADLLEDCDRLSQGIRVEDCRSDLEPLMRFEGNLTEPVHRWFNYKEGFSKGLVTHLLLKRAKLKGKSVAFLDPFCGVATSLLSAEDALRTLGISEITLRGVEVNPYVRFVARTKLSWDKYDPTFLMRAAAISTNGLRLPSTPSLPTLSTMQNPQFISKADLRKLIDLREKARFVAKGKRELEPLLLGIASAAERIFNLRKDGRALRYTPRTTEVSVVEEVMRSWHGIAEDLQLGSTRLPVDCQIVAGDGRRADRIFRRQFDVILFSPPYLNNIDYTEVYKIELWLLGFLKSSEEMVAQRRRTFRSHPSCIFPESPDASLEEVQQLLGKRFQRLLHHASYRQQWRHRLFTGYFADMLRTLRSCRNLLRRNGHIFLVIGNSLHGDTEAPIPVATDLWICKLADAAGLRVDSLMIGRLLARRSLPTPLLRESIIMFSRK